MRCVQTSHLAALKVASHMQDDPVVMAKLRCAAGLAAMDAKKYKQAALRFTEVMSVERALSMASMPTILALDGTRHLSKDAKPRLRPSA